MKRDDAIEAAGLVLFLAGVVMLGYGLYLLATWLLMVVVGGLLAMTGATAVYRANRGGE